MVSSHFNISYMVKDEVMGCKSLQRRRDMYTDCQDAVTVRIKMEQSLAYFTPWSLSYITLDAAYILSQKQI